jgi:hypothetical protein
MDVEPKDLSREGMLTGKLLGAPDALLPDGFGHKAIMGPFLRHTQILT